MFTNVTVSYLSHIIGVLNCSSPHCNKCCCKTHCCSRCKGRSAVPSPLERYSWRALYRSCNSSCPSLHRKCTLQALPLLITLWSISSLCFISFVCVVIVVFCCCLCTSVGLLCWRCCLHCAKWCSLCLAVSCCHLLLHWQWISSQLSHSRGVSVENCPQWGFAATCCA